MGFSSWAAGPLSPARAGQRYTSLSVGRFGDGLGHTSFQFLNHTSLTEGEESSTKPPETGPEPLELSQSLLAVYCPLTPPRGTSVPSLEAQDPGPALALPLQGMEREGDRVRSEFSGPLIGSSRPQNKQSNEGGCCCFLLFFQLY